VSLSINRMRKFDLSRAFPAYFASLDRLLTPSGRAGLQAITMPHDRMLATRGGHTWIHKHIFPGGQIPSLQAITDNLQANTTLRVTADYPMGPHYARTLAEWRSRFLDASAAVTELGFCATFQRMWNLYLAYSEAGFRAGYLDVHQLVLERSVSAAQPSTPLASSSRTAGTASPGGESS